MPFAHLFAVKAWATFSLVYFCKIRAAVKLVVVPLSIAEHAYSIRIAPAAPRQMPCYVFSFTAMRPKKPATWAPKASTASDSKTIHRLTSFDGPAVLGLLIQTAGPASTARLLFRAFRETTSRI